MCWELIGGFSLSSFKSQQDTSTLTIPCVTSSSLLSNLSPCPTSCLGIIPTRFGLKDFLVGYTLKIHSLSSLQVLYSPKNLFPGGYLVRHRLKISSIRKESPGPTHSQPPKRKADENPSFYFGKRSSSAGPQSTPT